MAVAGAAAATAAPGSSTKRTTDPRVNIIRINTDDMRADDLNAKDGNGAWLLPNLRYLRVNGINFTHHYTSFGKCATSRASAQTGLYATHHGLLTNDDAYHLFVNLGLEADSLQKRAQNAGYFTGLIGKYTNDYGVDPNDPFPSCFSWGALCWKTFYKYIAPFTLNENGTHVTYNNGEYITDILGQRCLDFFNAAANAGKPFFLEYWPNACHGPHDPSPQYAGTVDPEWMFIPPSFNVNIVNGVQHTPLTPDQIAAVKQTWAQRIETLRSVDDTVGQILSYLTLHGLIATTHILFTSDNGFMEGEHCIADGKGNLFVECMRMPLIWFGPGVVPGNMTALSSNVDVAATLADLMGILPGWTVIGKPIDGRSMVQLLSGNTANWDKAKLLQSPGSNDQGVENGIVTLYWWYTVSANGSTKQLFDMKSDSYQLVNQFANPDPIYQNAVTALAADLEVLKNCSGSTCSITHTYPPSPVH
jgi:arylsulfatase A-like enzyme